MPEIRTLFLSIGYITVDFNKICCVRNFKKVYWPSFDCLSIRKSSIKKDHNIIAEGQDLALMKAAKMRDIAIEFNCDDPYQFSELRWAAKLESQAL